MSNAGSFPWLLLVAGVYLFYRLWRGWRQGLARQAMGLVAVVAGIFAAIVGGQLLVAPFRSLWAAPDFLLLPLAQLAMGLLVYLLVAMLGRLLFPKTEGLATLGGRLVSGTGGALLSVAVGGCFVWVVFQGMRLSALVSGREPSWQTALREGWVADVLEMSDPMPPEHLELLKELREVLRDPVMAQRLGDYPPLKAIRTRKGIQDITDDQEVQRLMAQNRWAAFFRLPVVVRGMNDPEVRRLLTWDELRRAVDFARAGVPAP